MSAGRQCLSSLPQPSVNDFFAFFGTGFVFSMLIGMRVKVKTQ